MAKFDDEHRTYGLALHAGSERARRIAGCSPRPFVALRSAKRRGMAGCLQHAGARSLARCKLKGGLFGALPSPRPASREVELGPGMAVALDGGGTWPHVAVLSVSTAMRVIQVRQDLEIDPTGKRLGEYLGSHLRLERAVQKRVRLAQVTAVLGVPVWFAALLALPRLVFALAMTAFASGAVALGFAILGEARCRRSIGTMARRVRIEADRHQDEGE